MTDRGCKRGRPLAKDIAALLEMHKHLLPIPLNIGTDGDLEYLCENWHDISDFYHAAQAMIPQLIAAMNAAPQPSVNAEMREALRLVTDKLDLIDAPHSLVTLHLIDRARAALARAAAVKDGWQAIDSAPRDGTWLLLFSPDSENNPFIGQWREDDEAPDGGAWWQDNEGGFPIDAYPSHFRALPLPPSQEVG